MTFVLDTNILISAAMRNSTTRQILLDPSHDFVLPEFALEELRRCEKEFGVALHHLKRL